MFGQCIPGVLQYAVNRGIQVIASGGAQCASASNNVKTITGNINTSGASLIVVSVSGAGVADWTLTDSTGSSSNTWTVIRNVSNSGYQRNTFYYCNAPNTSSTHVFTVTPASGTSAQATISVLAISGTAASSPLDGTAGVNGVTIFAQSITSFPTTISPCPSGSFSTPTVNNEILVTSINSGGNNSVLTIPTGGWTAGYVAKGTLTSYGGGIAYQIQTTATAVAPTWTYASGNSSASAIAGFKPA